MIREMWGRGIGSKINKRHTKMHTIGKICAFLFLFFSLSLSRSLANCFCSFTVVLLLFHQRQSDSTFYLAYDCGQTSMLTNILIEPFQQYKINIAAFDNFFLLHGNGLHRIRHSFDACKITSYN